MNTRLRHFFLLITLLAAGAAQAATITVDGTVCTLAEAIYSANSNVNRGGCVGSGAYGNDTIILQQNVLLTAALPEISSTVIIEGKGHFISGNHNPNVGSVLRVASDGSLTLNEATVKNGNATPAGGGIYSGGGTITLNHSTVSGNSASSSSPSYYVISSNGGGIYSSGTITLNHSTISGNSVSSFYSSPSFYVVFNNGGGVYSGGTITLNNSTVSGNSVSSSSPFSSDSNGGGIYSDGAITLNNSTVSANSVSNPSSSPSSSPYSNGGGIYSYSGIVTLNNSTVSGNSASSHGCSWGGGLWSYEGTITLTNSTVSGNSAFSSSSSYGGGIYSGGGYNDGGNSGGTVTLHNSLVSGNTASFGGNEVRSYITSDSSNNVFGHSGETNDQAFYNFTPGSNDATATSDGTKPTALDAILNPLANNGGPTKTHALPAGSPAVDLDTACSAGTDQRGYPRPVGFGCDAGAYEFSAGTHHANMAPIYKLLLKERSIEPCATCPYHGEM